MGFGNPLHVWPDRDGDGVDDIAALVDSAAADGAHPAVLIISGKTGKIVAAIAPGRKQAYLTVRRPHDSTAQQRNWSLSHYRSGSPISGR